MVYAVYVGVSRVTDHKHHVGKIIGLYRIKGYILPDIPLKVGSTPQKRIQALTRAEGRGALNCFQKYYEQNSSDTIYFTVLIC